jgi:hypothetical protein
MFTAPLETVSKFFLAPFPTAVCTVVYKRPLTDMCAPLAKIANNLTRCLWNFRGLSQHGGRTDFTKNLCTSPFKDDLSNEPNFVRIISTVTLSKLAGLNNSTHFEPLKFFVNIYEQIYTKITLYILFLGDWEDEEKHRQQVEKLPAAVLRLCLKYWWVRMRILLFSCRVNCLTKSFSIRCGGV